jgi:signal transduction histidine kinase
MIKRSLSLKLVGLAVGSTLLFTLLLTGIGLWTQQRAQNANLTWLLDEVVESHRMSLADALVKHNTPLAEQSLQSLLLVGDVDWVSLDSDQGSPLSAGKSPEHVRLELTYVLESSPDGLSKRPVGTLTIRSGLQQSQKNVVAGILKIFAQQFFISALVGLVLFFIVNTSFVRPILKISTYLESFRLDRSLANLKIDRASLKGGYDELDSLVDNINSIKNRVVMSHWALKEMNLDLEKRVEERTATILEQRQKLETSARWSALGEMAGSIAHEINNPLAIIMGKSQLALRKEISDEVRNSLNAIVKTTQRIADIIQSLRVLSRDASRDPFDFVPASTILTDAMGLSNERLRQKEIEVLISENIDRYEISCRRVQIAQIIVNLINNAVDALEGKEQRWIKIDLFEKDSLLILSVVDSGVGFAKEIQNKVMTPFFTTKEVGKGTGLGLSLSKAIMTAHNGNLEVDFNAANTTINVSFKTFRHLDSSSLKIAG